jgi:hypothetical protein
LEGAHLAVNGEAYDADRLKSAIKLAARPLLAARAEPPAGAEPIELLIKDGTRYRTVKIPYHDGPRYPRLERVPGARARLDEILLPRK